MPAPDGEALIEIVFVKQTVVLLADNVGVTEETTLTLDMAELVQVPTPEITVYVVLTVGETIMVAELGGFIPLLAVQANGPEPELDKVIFCPLQITEDDGVIAIGAADETVTLMTEELVHVPTDCKTVYVVLAVGVETTIDPDELLKVDEGDHE
jgi:hypothetical protein